MSRRSLGSFALAGSLSLVGAASCDADEPTAMHARDGDDIDVFPFIPVCTACLMWTFADQRWALHRTRPGTTLELDAPPLPASAIELVAVRVRDGSGWLFTANAVTYEVGDFRIYAWAPIALDDASAAEWQDEPADDADSANKPIRTTQFWIAQGDDEGWCTVPWLGGAPLPEEKRLTQIVDDLEIEQQLCADVM